MKIIERGRGETIVFIQGLHGRWEYASLTVDALAKHFRVITFSLNDEPTADFAFDPQRPFDSYSSQVAAALDAAGCERAVVCGQSFGGLVALRFAATTPSRTIALVLASTPGPGWHLKKRHEIYARLPWICGPLFFVEAPFRAAGELAAALPAFRDRVAFSWNMLRAVLRGPLSPPRMAARARRIGAYDIPADCARITVPTLVLTGEPALDHVVPVDGTSRYATAIRGARTAVLARTGHLGSLTRADEFARLIREFVDRERHAAA
jgi:pimeloyl-ACP methyl ester carboxylesterase